MTGSLELYQSSRAGLLDAERLYKDLYTRDYNGAGLIKDGQHQYFKTNPSPCNDNLQLAELIASSTIEEQSMIRTTLESEASIKSRRRQELRLLQLRPRSPLLWQQQPL